MREEEEEGLEGKGDNVGRKGKGLGSQRPKGFLQTP